MLDIVKYKCKNDTKKGAEMAIEKGKPGRPKITKAERKRHNYTIRLDDNLDEALRNRAKKDKMTLADVVRKALEQYLIEK